MGYLYTETVSTDSQDRSDIELVPDGQRTSGWLLRVGRADQSYVDLDDPSRLEFDYVSKMAMTVDSVFAPEASLRVVHIGGAAMTYPRYIHETRPRSAQIVLEPDVYLTSFVRQHLPLPRRSGIRVRPISGEDGLQEMPDDYADVIVIDAYMGGQVPAALGTREVLTAAARVLRPTGLFIGNYPDAGPRTYLRRVLSGVVQCWPHAAVGAEPAVLKGRRFGNMLVAASQTRLPADELARRCASAPLPYRFISGQKLKEHVPAALPFTEADAQTSPCPPTWFT